MLQTIPPGRRDDAEERVDLLLEEVPDKLEDTIPELVEDGAHVSIYGSVGGARVVVDYRDDGEDATVEFNRYRQPDGVVSGLTVKFRPQP